MESLRTLSHASSGCESDRQDFSSREYDPEKLAKTLSELFPDNDHWIEIRHTVYSIHAPRKLSREEMSRCSFSSGQEENVPSDKSASSTQPPRGRRRGWRRLKLKPFWPLN
ncbi:hypothetical protein QBC44DRAFT_331089 [Cladorrhinum sp. PSN332]|nr:hypothetical protein QBC44DRAFT_331089 [Cladorrhinum sp. PSN332]